MPLSRFVTLKSMCFLYDLIYILKEIYLRMRPLELGCLSVLRTALWIYLMSMHEPSQPQFNICRKLMQCQMLDQLLFKSQVIFVYSPLLLCYLMLTKQFNKTFTNATAWELLVRELKIYQLRLVKSHKSIYCKSDNNEYHMMHSLSIKTAYIS